VSDVFRHSVWCTECRYVANYAVIVNCRSKRYLNSDNGRRESATSSCAKTPQISVHDKIQILQRSPKHKSSQAVTILVMNKTVDTSNLLTGGRIEKSWTWWPRSCTNSTCRETDEQMEREIGNRRKLTRQARKSTHVVKKNMPSDWLMFCLDILPRQVVTDVYQAGLRTSPSIWCTTLTFFQWSLHLVAFTGGPGMFRKQILATER
jgi:hypothetical protein